MPSYKVISAQNVSSMCAVCGQSNDWGLKGHFYNLENGDLYAVFSPIPEHQSYPGRVHGGVAGAIIDECIGRAVNAAPAVARGEEDMWWGVTIDLTTKYRKPTPYETGELYCVARITKRTTRFFSGQAFLYSSDGTLCMEGTARYIRLGVEEIADGPLPEAEWFADPLPCPATVEIPVYPQFKE